MYNINVIKMSEPVMLLHLFFRIHVMSGAVETVNEANVETYERNIKHAASVFEKENIIGLIEPINPYSVPKYYMNNFHKGTTGVM